MNIHASQCNILTDANTDKVNWACAALDKIQQNLTQRVHRFHLDPDERTQIISALAYVRSQRCGGNGDAAQQHRDWTEAESDLDLILMHLRVLHHV